jgi:hypothetical protein
MNSTSSGGFEVLCRCLVIIRNLTFHSKSPKFSLPLGMEFHEHQQLCHLNSSRLGILAISRRL